MANRDLMKYRRGGDQEAYEYKNLVPLWIWFAWNQTSGESLPLEKSWIDAGFKRSKWNVVRERGGVFFSDC